MIPDLSFYTFSILNFAITEWFCHVTCFAKVFLLFFFLSYFYHKKVVLGLRIPLKIENFKKNFLLVHGTFHSLRIFPQFLGNVFTLRNQGREKAGSLKALMFDDAEERAIT